MVTFLSKIDIFLPITVISSQSFSMQENLNLNLQAKKFADINFCLCLFPFKDKHSTEKLPSEGAAKLSYTSDRHLVVYGLRGIMG